MLNVLTMADILKELGYKNSVKLFHERPTNVNLIKHIHKLYWDAQAKGEIDWLYSCKGKTVYGTAWEATKAAYRQSEWRGRDYDPYHCRFCGKYHVGRTVEDREARKAYYEAEIRRNQGIVPQRKEW